MDRVGGYFGQPSQRNPLHSNTMATKPMTQIQTVERWQQNRVGQGQVMVMYKSMIKKIDPSTLKNVL